MISWHEKVVSMAAKVDMPKGIAGSNEGSMDLYGETACAWGKSEQRRAERFFSG